jgi:hypothetical protein
LKGLGKFVNGFESVFCGHPFACFTAL